MKESKLNVENLSKPELLMLFSILEGELEARDLVIDTLKAQRTDLHTQQRYGRYSLSDPFLALQRDSEAVGGQRETHPPSAQASNPLVVLRLVVSHCRGMQEKMLAQLAAAESRHRMVIADLEEEKRRHAEDTAEGDDVTYVLEKERERLIQQLEFERSQVRRLEKEQRRTKEVQEEERAQHKQLSCALAKECKWASSRALEEGRRVSEMSLRLDEEEQASRALRQELEEERRRALRMEARVEEQLAEFDTEREQLRSRLRKEEAHCSRLKEQVEVQRRKMEPGGGGGEREEKEKEEEKTGACPVRKVGETNSGQEQKHLWAEPVRSKLNGHHVLKGINGKHVLKETNGKQDLKETNGKQDLKETNGKQDLKESNGNQDLKESNAKIDIQESNGKNDLKDINGHHDLKESSVICSSKESSVICSSKESSVICSSKESSVICSSKESSVICSSKESSVICSSKDTSGICSSKESSGICSSKDTSVICPSKDTSVICPSKESGGNHLSVENSGPPTKDDQQVSEEIDYLENGCETHTSPSTLLLPHLPQDSSSSSSSSFSSPPGLSSPSSSPVHPPQRPPGSPNPAGYQSSYQAGIHQRFHSARHRFQGVGGEPERPLSPRDLSPSPPNPSPEPSPVRQLARSTVTQVLSPSPPNPSPEPSPVRQLARSTVTQVLSRFTTVQQSAAAKLPAAAAMANSSPFGTDYRNLAPPSPIIGRASSGAPLPLQGGLRSPVISRADRGHPPPIPPKKPGLAQSPPSPALGHRSPAHVTKLSGNCGLDSGSLEPEAVESST